MAIRPCIVCGTPSSGTRCRAHRLTYPFAERERMRRAVSDHIAAFGYWCPGWQRPPHPSTDLTADHLLPRAEGGNGTDLAVLCRPCNSRRGTSPPDMPPA